MSGERPFAVSPSTALGLCVIAAILLVPAFAFSQWARLPKGPIEMNGHEVVVEVARTPEEQAQGLMYRNLLADNEGMLFAYSDARRLSFWMKNTTIALSIAFIDENAVIRQIEDMKPLSERAILSKTKCRYALEMNQGWFERHEVKAGDAVDLSALIDAGILEK